MKFVVKGALPVKGESCLLSMSQMISEKRIPEVSPVKGDCRPYSSKGDYIDHLMGYVDVEKLRPLKIVVNSGNGCAGGIVDLLEQRLPFTFIKVQHDADGRFPNGVPNPLLVENRELTTQAVKEHGADLGIAWDGDFDRCFFWDENGDFIEGYYVVGLLAQVMLQKESGATILYDPRLTWNSYELISQFGGVPVMTKTGHAFIKERMRQENALYGGEMSAHHYFRDFGYCDSGMIPWLLVASLLSAGGGCLLSTLVEQRKRAYPVSGEINNRVADPDAVIAAIEEKYADGRKDYTDGLSVEFDNYRFNVRKSNTEPLLRLNVETRGDQQLLEEKTRELLGLIC
jgi:phosphomannomutase